MLGGLGLSEWVLGGAGVLAVIAAVAIRAFKNERVKRKAAESTTRVQAGKAEVAEEASKARLHVVADRDKALDESDKAAAEKKAHLDKVERSIVSSSLKDLASKWNMHIRRTKKEDSAGDASTK